MQVPSEAKKERLDPLELGLQVLVGAGSGSVVLGRSSVCGTNRDRAVSQPRRLFIFLTKIFSLFLSMLK